VPFVQAVFVPFVPVVFVPFVQAVFAPFVPVVFVPFSAGVFVPFVPIRLRALRVYAGCKRDEPRSVTKLAALYSAGERSITPETWYQSACMRAAVMSMST
jgi:hypothetical protein